MNKFNFNIACISDLYDFGVTKDAKQYFIVMRLYPTSLKKWRQQLDPHIAYSPSDLPLYLAIFGDILKAVLLLHSHHVTHYDLKADNILIDFIDSNAHGGHSHSSSTRGGKLSNEDTMMLGRNLQVILADFGECNMFSSEQDEYCLLSRGTD